MLAILFGGSFAANSIGLEAFARTSNRATHRTLELPRAEHKAFKMKESDNDESQAIEASD
jgi:hypothetical protein